MFFSLWFVRWSDAACPTSRTVRRPAASPTIRLTSRPHIVAVSCLQWSSPWAVGRCAVRRQSPPSAWTTPTSPDHRHALPDDQPLKCKGKNVQPWHFGKKATTAKHGILPAGKHSITRHFAKITDGIVRKSLFPWLLCFCPPVVYYTLLLRRQQQQLLLILLLRIVRRPLNDTVPEHPITPRTVLHGDAPLTPARPHRRSCSLDSKRSSIRQYQGLSASALLAESAGSFCVSIKCGQWIHCTFLTKSAERLQPRLKL